MIHGRPTVDGFADAEGRDWDWGSSRQERRRLLVGSLLLPCLRPFPFIYPPNLRVRPSAAQRLVVGKVLAA